MVLKINKIKYNGIDVKISYNQVMDNADDIKIELNSFDKPNL